MSDYESDSSDDSTLTPEERELEEEYDAIRRSCLHNLTAAEDSDASHETIVEMYNNFFEHVGRYKEVWMHIRHIAYMTSEKHCIRRALGTLLTKGGASNLTVKEAAHLYAKAELKDWFPYCPAMLVTTNDCCCRAPSKIPRPPPMLGLPDPTGLCGLHYRRYILAKSKVMLTLLVFADLLNTDLAVDIAHYCTRYFHEFNTVWTPTRSPYENWDHEGWIHPRDRIIEFVSQQKLFQ